MLLTTSLAIIPMLVSGTILNRHVEPALADMGDLVVQLKDLDAAIANFTNSGGNQLQVLDIHLRYSNLTQATGNASETVLYCLDQNGRPAEISDAVKMLDIAQNLYTPALLATLGNMSLKQPEFAAVGAVPLFFQDLVIYNASTISYLDGLSSGAPPGVINDTANEIKAEVAAAFESTILVYNTTNTNTTSTTNGPTTTTTSRTTSITASRLTSSLPISVTSTSLIWML